MRSRKTLLFITLILIALAALPLRGYLRLEAAHRVAAVELGDLRPESFERVVDSRLDATPSLRTAIASMVIEPARPLSGLGLDEWGEDELELAIELSEANERTWAALDEALRRPSSDWDSDAQFVDRNHHPPIQDWIRLGRIPLIDARRALLEGDEEGFSKRIRTTFRLVDSLLEEGTVMSWMVAEGMIYQSVEAVAEALERGALVDPDRIREISASLPANQELDPRPRLRFELAYGIDGLRSFSVGDNAFARALWSMLLVFDGDNGKAVGIEAFVDLAKAGDGPATLLLPRPEPSAMAFPSRMIHPRFGSSWRVSSQSLFRRTELAMLRAALDARLASLEGREWTAPEDGLPLTGQPLIVIRETTGLGLEIGDCELWRDRLEQPRSRSLCRIVVAD